MELRFFLIAEYAVVGQDGRVSICGMIDSLTATLPAEAPAAGEVNLPKMMLVAGVECSIAEGTVHRSELRIVNGDGQALVDEPISLGEWRFNVNPHGVPMRYNQVIQLNTVPMPTLGDCVFQLWVDGQHLGDATLHVFVNRANPEA